ncbi:rab proteins geranylgeranyltransferase component A 1 isoform X1 [Cyprinodon tularosa]|uniref:rab proteins geranylgeranyltransferase component A 1 isoform X1 n=1 Tax=Cyprinodon tularosa TaxID=77115 RepID=UPI0018E2455D|nr:rab proteins geranylgeranyltransferase component A 1 isoform X1 [Cyprinodon tularosa]
MRSRDSVPAANMAAEELPSDFEIVILGTGLAESVVAAACSRVGQRVLHLDRRSHYAANWASFTFNGLLTWIEEQKEESKPEKIEDWSSLVEEGEELIHLSNSEPASITNLQVFSYTSEEEEADEPNTIEEEKAAGEDAVKESSETESAGSKEEEDAGPAEGEEPAETEEEEPEADQPPASPPSSQSEPIRKKISHAQLVKEGRRFNIDLVSKLLFSRGSLVDLLIKSNVSRYAEFKNVTRILTYRHGNIEQVPCSRADVFASRQLSVVEKRKLMRFLTSCMEETEEQTAYSGRPYSEFLRDQQLGESLQHFLLHSIAMVTEDTPTEEGLASTRHFLRCLGRYGNTPFLFPVYGLGEIPQCFCRMSAVFGGIYCLRHSVHCLIVDKDTNRCKAVIDSRGQRISCNHVVLEDSYLDADRKPTATPPRYLSRAVLITDASVLPSDPDQQISMVTVPPATTGGPSVKMVELSSSTMTCIPGTYLVHLTCQSVGSAHEDLLPVVTRIFRTTEPQEEDRRPSVLWCLYFNMADGSALEVEGHRVPSNVYVCSGPDGALGHEHTIRQAESIFQKILPEEEFCPPAPNPEDIIYDGDNASPGEDRTAVENGGNQEENQEKEGNQEENQEENQEKEGNQEEIQEKKGDQEENGVNQEPEE